MIEASILNLAELGILVVGVVIALVQLRGIKQTRQAELFSVLMERMDNVEWWRYYLYIREASDWTYNDWGERIREDFSVYGGLMSISYFLNHVGWLVKKGLIDLEVIQENLSEVVVRVYENTMPLFKEYERRTGRPQRFSHLKYLYEQVKDLYYQFAQDIKT